ncbi:GHMP kinase [bacterium]|nr:GHMP kinase [bacterium]
MLIVRSPLRISLAGGGTDLPVYYRNYGGAVINTSIDRYFYVFLKTESSNGLEIASADFRTFFRHDGNHPLAWEGDLELPRAIFHHFGINNGLSLFLASEIPPGTGLGSSSSVSVGLIKALSAACGLNMSREDISELACFIEIEKLGSPIGKQDQYAATFGGLNLITFEADKTQVTPLNLSQENRNRLERSLMLFYTGQSRKANDILSRQNEASGKKQGATLDALHRVKEMVPNVRKCFESGDIEGFGMLLDQNWQEKKRFAKGVSNQRIDDCYDAAVRAGALGGKVTGAGGGGFLLLCCDESRQEPVIKEMEALGLIKVGFHFEDMGARVIMNSGLRLTTRHEWKGFSDLIARV